MRIAITGASGLLGEEVVRELSMHKLVLLGRSLRLLQNKFPDRYCAETDYSLQSLSSVLDGCDAVIHLAARLYDPKHPELTYYLDNLEHTEALYRACENLNIFNVVFASTRAIYDPSSNKIPFNETEVPCPSNVYAFSKHACELLSGLHGKLKIKSLRLAQIIHDPPRSGFMLKMLMDRARAGENLTIHGSGLGARDYLYSKDAARACAMALSAPDVSGVFNVGSGRAVSHLELAESIASIIGEDKIKVILDQAKPDDSSVFLMDSSLFAKTFHWAPQFSLNAALRDMEEVRRLGTGN